MSDSPAVAAPKPLSHGAQRLLITVALLGVGAMLILALIAISSLGRFGPEPAPVVGKTEGERFAVASIDDVQGTNLLRVRIATESSINRGSAYSSGSGVDARNLILVDKASGLSRRLLPDNRRGIIGEYFLPAAVETEATVPVSEGSDAVAEVAPKTAKRPPPPAAYYLLRVRVGKGSTEDVLLGDIKSGRQAFVLTNIDGVDRVWMQTPTRVAILMRQGRKLQYRAFDLPDPKPALARAIEID